MAWLVTGGAGYIGAHVVRALLDAGEQVVVVDDLSSGLRRKVPDQVVLVEADVRDRDALARALATHRVEGVVHLAAKKAVAESVAQPMHYYRENVDGVLSLVEAMTDAGVSRIVFSSSAAVYGSPDTDFVREETPTIPMSPYGGTKLVGEWAIRDATTAYGLTAIALRYFNVAGAGAADLGDTGANNLIPMVLRAYSNGQRPQVFGADYSTADGSCIRDYIHVADLADAHVIAAQRLASETTPWSVYNIGRGVGSSVFEVMDSVGAAIGEPLNPEVVQRRAGDPARIVASAEAARAGLGWSATRDLDDMVTSAWSAWQQYPPS